MKRWYTTGKFPRSSSVLTLYINDTSSNCPDKLSCRIFAHDTYVFETLPCIRVLEKLGINEELAKIKEWCDLNKLLL